MGIMDRISGAFAGRRVGPALELVRGPKRWPVGHRPLALGRGPDSDIPIPGESVSRLHAWIVPGASGVLLVDQSRSGTTVNGERLTAPRLLQPGDEIAIAEVVYRVVEALPSPTSRQELAGRGRLGRWLRRYGPSEVLATVAAVGAAAGLHEVTGSVAAAAYAGSLAETVVFYGVMFLRQSIREAHQAGVKGRGFGSRDLLPVARNMMLEFGAAEVLDTLAMRPLLMGLGLEFIGGNLGALAGKLGADLIFYGPVLASHEWRLARQRAEAMADRRRRTTVTSVPRVEEE